MKPYSKSGKALMRQLMDAADVSNKEHRARILAEVEQALTDHPDDYDRSEIIQAACLYWWIILGRQYSLHKDSLQERAKRAAEAKAKAGRIKAAIKSDAVREFLASMTPLGKLVRDCRRTDCVKMSGIWVALGKKLRGRQTIGAAFATGTLKTSDITKLL